MADAVSLNSLVVSGYFSVQFGVGASPQLRTVELHSDETLYCFEEPEMSMAKHLREKMYIIGCRVVDCGTYNGSESLAVFLQRYDYAERVDNLGNVQGHPLPRPQRTAHPHPEWHRGCGLVLLATQDKRVKARFLRCLQQASQEYVNLFHSSPTSTTAANALPRNNFDRVLMGAASHHSVSSSSSSISVLSNHEVLQLSDVLEEYERIQREGSRVMLPDEEDEEVLEEATACAPPAYNARLKESPLYLPCMAGNAANQVCADCGDAMPSWCVLQPFGCFVCIHCVGVHRELWANKCREVEMDLWPEDDVAFMGDRGNAVVNTELEYCVAYPCTAVEASLGLQAYKPAGPFSDIDLRTTFIQSKYRDRLFTRSAHPDEPSQREAPVDPVGLAAASLADESGEASAAVACSTEAAMLSDGPPQYTGLLDVIVKELVAPDAHPGAVCSLTNGFQTLNTKPARRLLHLAHSTAWDESLQLGVETAKKPLYCCVYNARSELIAATEFFLPQVVADGETAMLSVDLPWCQLNRKPSHRKAKEVWHVSMLVALRFLY